MRFNRVLLVNPPSKGEWKGFRPHIGLGYIAEFLLANGVEVEVLDMNLGHDMRALQRRIDEFQPDVLGHEPPDDGVQEVLPDDQPAEARQPQP